MLKTIKQVRIIKRIRKTMLFSRFRQYFPMPEPDFLHKQADLEEAEIVRIDWPDDIKKPSIGIIQDNGKYLKWIRYRRFLENNKFHYQIYNIHAHDWIDRASDYDIIVGFSSNAFFDLRELRRKYYYLETYLGKYCYPSTSHAALYEDKSLEAYISQKYNFPFIKTYITHDKEDAFKLVENLSYPVVSKVDPTSGSIGVELVQSVKHARKIVEQAFSPMGRNTHTVYFKQKNYIYFQDYVPNDGYDIRVIVIGDWVMGYYRKVPVGDFRASGMQLFEKRALPVEAMIIARQVNQVIKSPMLVVDMLHGTDGKFYIIEYSPIATTSVHMEVNGIPGVYVFTGQDTFHFQEGKYWVQELALREFLVKDYLQPLLKGSS